MYDEYIFLLSTLLRNRNYYFTLRFSSFDSRTQLSLLVYFLFNKNLIITFSGSIILAKSNSNNENGIDSYSAKITVTISIIKLFN